MKSIAGSALPLKNLSNPKPYHFAVFIGRMKPFHKGHQKVILRGLKQAQRVIVVCGSADEARSERNPFTWRESAQMVMDSIPHAGVGVGPSDEFAFMVGGHERVLCTPVADEISDALWAVSVQSAVRSMISMYSPKLEAGETVRIALIGCEKEGTGFYEKLFPEWGSLPVEPEFIFDSKTTMLAATQIRNGYFRIGMDWLTAIERENRENPEKCPVPESTIKFLQSFFGSKEYTDLQKAYDITAKYDPRKYPRKEVTVDSVVHRSSHILLVRRGQYPGKGLWALPGGFVEQYEDLVDGAVRELIQETSIAFPGNAKIEPILRGSIKGMEVVSDPHRDPRGRVITFAYLFDLGKGPLPIVKGGDDAEHAAWFPISEIRRDMMFLDHYLIIKKMVGKIRDHI